MTDDLKNKTGIFENGSGNVYRYVLMDPSISLSAKAVYAYLCSYGDAANEGTEVYPSVETITGDLNMSVPTYNTAMNLLISRDLVIRSERMIIKPGERPRQTSNSYQINLRPKDFKPNPKAAVYTGTILDYKYGPIAKKVMRDRNIKNWRSKALYAYYCSFVGSEDFSKIDIKLVCYYLDIDRHTLSRIKKDIENIYIRHEDIRNESGVKVGGQRVYILGINTADEKDIKITEIPVSAVPLIEKDSEEDPKAKTIIKFRKAAPEEFLIKIGYYRKLDLIGFMIKASPEEHKEYFHNQEKLAKAFADALYEIAEEYPSLKEMASSDKILDQFIERAMSSYPIRNPKQYLIKCMTTELDEKSGS